MKLTEKLLFLVLLTVLIGCGGGGDSDGSDGDSNPGPTDVCSVLGVQLKVINGSQCGNLSQSPVVLDNLQISAHGGATVPGTLITPDKRF